MTKHISLDLETLGTGPKAVIIQAGAVVFTADDIMDAEPGEANVLFERSFQCNFRWQDQLDHGRTITEQTLRFWFNQPEAQRASVLSEENIRHTHLQLRWLYNWFKGQEIDGYLWIRGLDFDWPMLEDIYATMGEGLSLPIKYNQKRDVRTLLDLVPKAIMPHYGAMGHTGLPDAIHQAQCIQAAWKHLKMLGVEVK